MTLDVTSLPLVASLPPGAPDRSLFSDEEQRFAPYLVSLAAMANDIVDDDGSSYGFMAGGWWRAPSVPGNARVQEHVSTLSWFATHERAWNPYFLDAALIARLDAAIGHYLSLQQSSGAFPVPDDPESRATTGFGLVALSSTLANLRSESLLPARQSEMEPALVAASNWFLNVSGQWDQPIDAVNQTVGGLVGVRMALDLVQDPGLEADLASRIDFLVEHGQSPAGFYYEGLSADHGYNFEVMLPDLGDLYLRTGHPGVAAMAQAWGEWFAYNCVREPQAQGAITVAAPSGRTSFNYLVDISRDADRAAGATLLRGAVSSLDAFFTAEEDRAALRAAWRANTSTVPGLIKGDTSPRILLHAALGENYPTAGERSAAIGTLPYLVSTKFVEQRADPIGQHHLFVREPEFYFAAYFGVRSSNMVRSGPNLLWHPVVGTLIHSRNDADGRQWETRLTDGLTTSKTNLSYSITDDGHTRVEYQTTDGRIVGTVTVADQLKHKLKTSGAATHVIPLLLRSGDVLTLDGVGDYSGLSALSGAATGVTLVRGQATIRIEWDRSLPSTIASTGRTYFPGASRSQHIVSLSFTDNLELRFSVD